MQNSILEQAKKIRLNLVFNLIEKIKSGTFLNVYFSRTKQDKILISQLTTPNKVAQQFGLENQMKRITY